jgi:hypothetical protein
MQLEILEIIFILGQTLYLKINENEKEIISKRLQHKI